MSLNGKYVLDEPNLAKCRVVYLMIYPLRVELGVRFSPYARQWPNSLALLSNINLVLIDWLKKVLIHRFCAHLIDKDEVKY